MIDVMKIADAADMIINGYAFTKEADFIRVFEMYLKWSKYSTKGFYEK